MKKSEESEELAYVVMKEDLQALKNYIDDPYADSELKLQILNWMWDKRKQINSNKNAGKNYHRDVYTFLKLIETK
tara:strand:- start:266 stop:490 length:225 start_codon:yes stop_codon:yes gene_type:complete